MPREYTNEEKNEIEHLVAETIKFRNAFNLQVEDGFTVTDEQIRNNVLKKYDNYKRLNNFFKTEEINSLNNQIIKDKGRNKGNIIHREPEFLDVRSSTGSFNEKQFNDFIKNTNTPNKAINFYNKNLLNELSLDSRELLKISMDGEKSIDYFLGHTFEVELFASMKNKINSGDKESLQITKCSLKTSSYIKDSVSIMEGINMGIRSVAEINGSLVGFLFDSYLPKIDDKIVASFANLGQDKKFGYLCEGSKKYDPFIRKASKALSYCSNISTDLNNELLNYFDENNITGSIADYEIDEKTKKEKKIGSISDAIAKGVKITKKSDLEINKIREHLQSTNDDALIDSYKNKSNSIVLTQEEFNRVKLIQPKLVTEENYDKYHKDADEKSAARDFELFDKVNRDKKMVKDITRLFVDLKEKEHKMKRAKGFSLFISKILPDSWTEIGRIRVQIKESKAHFEQLNLSHAYKKFINGETVVDDILGITNNVKPTDKTTEDIYFNQNDPVIGKNVLDNQNNVGHIGDNNLDLNNVIQNDNSFVKSDK